MSRIGPVCYRNHMKNRKMEVNDCLTRQEIEKTGKNKK